MAVSASMDATPNAPAHGQTLTVSYTVTGNDAIPPSTAQVTGGVVVGGTHFDVSTNITMPGTPAAAVTYDTPAAAGLTFTVNPADPSSFTAVVP